MKAISHWVFLRIHVREMETHTIYGIFTYIWLIFMGFHVGKYTSPMDPIGKGLDISAHPQCGMHPGRGADAVPVDETQSARVRVCVRFRRAIWEDLTYRTHIFRWQIMSEF